jgi:hypothetical protein
VVPSRRAIARPARHLVIPGATFRARGHPVAVYSVVAVLFLVCLSFIPGINNLGQVW